MNKMYVAMLLMIVASAVRAAEQDDDYVHVESVEHEISDDDGTTRQPEKQFELLCGQAALDAVREMHGKKSASAMEALESRVQNTYPDLQLGYLPDFKRVVVLNSKNGRHAHGFMSAEYADARGERGSPYLVLDDALRTGEIILRFHHSSGHVPRSWIKEESRPQQASQ